MEESQARDTRDRRLTTVKHAPTPDNDAMLHLRRVRYLDFGTGARPRPSTLLGAVAYGPQRPPPLENLHAPMVWVPMAVPIAEPFLELWESTEPVARHDAHGVCGAHDTRLAFGCVQSDVQGSLDTLAESAYCRVFDYLDGLGFPHLLRAWNYFPDINRATGDIERYRLFNVGRHQAFAAKGRVIGEQTPAASALGCQSGALTVFFLAGKSPGRPVENPRQVSAYRYPDRYGQRSPIFSRAMILESGPTRSVLVSGTASIVGHETLHGGNIDAQIAETTTNLRTILDEACGAAATRDKRDLALKAYVRHGRDAARVQAALERAFAGADIVYLEADICRSDLLVEVEAVYFERR